VKLGRGARALGLAVLVGVVALALLLRDRGESAGPALAHGELVRVANGVCTRLARDNRRLAPPPRPYDARAIDFFNGLHDNVAEAGERFEELEPPRPDRAELGRLVTHYRSMAIKLESAAGAASVEQDPEVGALLLEVGRIAAEVEAVERALGICEGRTSARRGIAEAAARSSREDPLGETGSLVP